LALSIFKKLAKGKWECVESKQREVDLAQVYVRNLGTLAR
jgi:hypothetical protein